MKGWKLCWLQLCFGVGFLYCLSNVLFLSHWWSPRPKNSLLFVHQADVAKMRAGYHDSQTQRETFDAEAKRYKVLLITIVLRNLPFPFI